MGQKERMWNRHGTGWDAHGTVQNKLRTDTGHDEIRWTGTGQDGIS